MSYVSVVGCKMGNSLSNVGKYPPEYKPAVHGPYDPTRYYGKPDTPFREVKLGELPSWIGRRNMSPISIVQAMGRGFHKWARGGVQATHHCFAPFLQVMFVIVAIQYWAKYNKIKCDRRSKYH